MFFIKCILTNAKFCDILTAEFYFRRNFKMKKVNKISMVVLKILEIGHWIGSVSMLVAFILTLMGSAGIRNTVDFSGAEGDTMLNTYGFEVAFMDNTDAVKLRAIALFAIGAALILFLMAMVFRNTYLIIKKSQNTTPFQKDNIRMVREIGIFTIAVPIIALIMSNIMHLVLGDGIETSVRFDSAVIGIVVLALTNVFSYGMELQNDVDGLL